MTALLDRAFSALSHPTRRAILSKLATEASTVNELAQPFSISLPAISRHLRMLEKASLVTQERVGQFRRYQVNREGLQAAGDWLDDHRKFWSDSLDRLDEHLQASPKVKGQGHGRPRHAGRKR